MTASSFCCFAWTLALVAPNLNSVAQTVTLSFRPPVGAVVEIHRERTITTVTRQTVEIDNEKTLSLMGFEISSDRYQVFEVVREMSRTINGNPFDNPAHKFLIGRTNAFIVSLDGDLLRLEGQERMLDEVKAFFPTNAHALLEKELGGEQPYLKEKERWDRNMRRFVGRTLKEGDVWKETVALPTARNAPPRQTYEANRVEKIGMIGRTAVVTIVTFRSGDSGEIENLDPAKLSMAEGAKFIRQLPESPPFTRVIQRRTFEADTMLPIHDERVWRGSERKPTEWAITTERQVETYRRVK